MLAGRTLEEVLQVAGTDQTLDGETRRRTAAAFGVVLPDTSYPIATFGGVGLGELMRKHPTLWVSVFSPIDPHFAHACIIHERELYDPFAGMNPTWPWHRVIAKAMVVTPIS